jgi:hypothetical protein
MSLLLAYNELSTSRDSVLVESEFRNDEVVIHVRISYVKLR